MYLITITLKTTAHQIVLGYDTVEAAEQARENIFLEGLCDVKDDYGSIAEFRSEDIAFVVLSTVRQRLAMENERGILQLKADNQFQTELQQDPTMKFLVGSKNPLFDKG